MGEKERLSKPVTIGSNSELLTWQNSQVPLLYPDLPAGHYQMVHAVPMT